MREVWQFWCKSPPFQTSSPPKNAVSAMLADFYNIYSSRVVSVLRNLDQRHGRRKKSRIRETPTLSTDADSRTNTNLKRLHDLSKKKKLPPFLGVTFGRHFWPPLLAATFGHHFWPPLLAATFGRHFWPPLLTATFGVHFWPPLLGSTFGRHFRGPLLTATFGVLF